VEPVAQRTVQVLRSSACHVVPGRAAAGTYGPVREPHLVLSWTISDDPGRGASVLRSSCGGALVARDLMETIRRELRRLTDPPAVELGDEAMVDASAEAAPRGEDAELARLARRLGEQHPDVAADTLHELIEHANDALADARVQNFKLILVERAVRRELAARSGWTCQGWSAPLDTAVGASDRPAPRRSDGGSQLR